MSTVHFLHKSSALLMIRPREHEEDESTSISGELDDQSSGFDWISHTWVPVVISSKQL